MPISHAPESQRLARRDTLTFGVTLPPGTRIGPYPVVAKLGEGGPPPFARERRGAKLWRGLAEAEHEGPHEVIGGVAARMSRVR